MTRNKADLLSTPELAIQAATPPESHRFHFLDALRGVAAILVVPRHAPNNFHHALAFFSSFLAVDFFFCLSGFVVAFSYERRLASSFSLGAFALTRIIRLYPLAILGTFFGTLLLVLEPAAVGAAHIPLHTFIITISLGLLVLPLPGGILFPLDTPMWTLFLEMIGNLAYAALMRLRIGQSWILAVAASLAFVALFWQRNLLGRLDLGFAAETFPAGLCRVIFSFFVGVLICRLYQARRPRRLQGPRAIWSASALTFVLVALLSNSLPSAHTSTAEMFTIGFCFPTILYLGSLVVLPGRWTTLCSFLGAVSYPLYILHQPLLAFFRRVAIPNGAAALWSMVLAIFLLAITAWVAAEFFDRPLRRDITNSIRKVTPAAKT